MGYKEAYERALNEPDSFWLEQAEQIPWFKKPETILDRDPNGAWRWFRGGKINTCYAALDYHVESGAGEQVALIYDSPVTGQVKRYTYKELLDLTARAAGALSSLGVKRGDRVVIYMPMVPEAVIAMLACARIGAVHSVVFGGFAAPELAARIDDAAPKLVISASCGIEFARIIEYKPLLDKAIELAQNKPEKAIILQREQARAETIEGRDYDWHELLETAEPAPCVELDAVDPLYILYTSGTTGKPKGVVRDNGGHAVALHYSMKAIYDMEPGDVFWAASDVGWVVGHSYIVYGPLLKGCTTVLYEGKPVRTPDAGAFWRVVADHNVKALFTAPTAFRAIKKEDPDCLLKSAYDVSHLKYLFLAGERLDPPTYHWLKEHLAGVPIIDHWWQTETGWSICSNMAGLELMETKPGSPTLPVPGYNLRVLDETGAELGPNQEGAIVLKGPLPPGTLPTLWGDHQRFLDSYWAEYPGHYLTGDGGYRDEEGYLFVMGRMDDVINVAGHRLSTGQIEEVVAAHPAVAECAVIGAHDVDKGQKPMGFVQLKDGVDIAADQLRADLVSMVREQVGAIANFKDVIVANRLPKTRSGKILRNVMRKMVDGKPYEAPSTIEDPDVLEELLSEMTVYKSNAN